MSFHVRILAYASTGCGIEGTLAFFEFKYDGIGLVANKVIR